MKTEYKKLKNLFLRQSCQDAWEDYARSIRKVNFPRWDYVILTSSNEEQARSFRSQIADRLEQGVLPAWTKYFVLPDGQKTKMPYNPATGERARINDLRTFADFKTTLVTYAMGGYDGIGIAVGNGIGAFDIDHCIREDGTLNDTANTVLSIFPTAYVEKSPSGKGLRGFFCVPEDYVYDKTVYYINNRSKGLEVYMPGATNRFVTVTGDVYRTGEIPNDETAMTTLLDTLMKRNKQVQQNHFQHHSYLDDEAVIAHANEASNSDKFKKLYAGDWEDLYGSQSDADMALLSILAFWCGCDEEQMDRIFRTSGLMRDKWDRKQAGSTYGAISIRNTVNTCSAVYMPVNAQDIVDEEFSKLDEDEEYQPDISKTTLTLEEMAPHSNPRYGREEIGMGNAFADYFKPIARYNSERGIWYVYDGSVWRADAENLRVAELAKLLADKLYVFALTITEEDARKRFIDRVRKLQLRRNRDTMIKDAKSVFPLAMKNFDRDIYLFNMANGTLDLRTGEFREHRPEDFLTKVSPVEYDPDAKCDRFVRFMDEVMMGDKDTIRYTQKALGYALSGDTRMECFFILYGATSRNGKGTLMESFLRLMGDYGRNADPVLLAMKFNAQSNGPTEELARLAGSRFVNISEPEKKLTIDAALTKRLTGNDTITARYLHENSFEFRAGFKIFINTNYQPNITDLTLFHSGRVKMIPFNRHFEESEQDKGLKTFFAQPENMSGIFNWVYEGFKLFIKEGLEMPQAVRQATADYEMESDKIGQFCALCLQHKKGEELRSAAVYDIYKKWAEANNLKAVSQGNFNKELAQKFELEPRRPWKEKGNSTTFVNDCTWASAEEDDSCPLESAVPAHIEKRVRSQMSTDFSAVE